MGVFSRLFGFRNAVVVYATPHTVTSTTIDPVTLPAVVRATQLIAADIARLPIRIEREDGKAVESPILTLLNREASRWQSSYEFKRYTTAAALTTGNGVAIIRRDGNGDIIELQPVPADSCIAEMKDEGVEYRVGSSVLTSDQVLHVGAYHDQLNPAWYISPLDASGAAMRLAADQDAAHSALIRTGSTGKVALSHPGAMSDQTVEAIRNAWANMHATADGASKPLILREGMKAEKISQETATSNIESRKFSVQEIARAFGVPPEMLYQQGGGALASQVETARAYVDGALSQWVNAWESEITRKLCGPGERARFDVDILLRGNLRDAGMAFSKLVLAGVMSPNDARKRLGLEPIEGLDTPTVSMPGGASAATGPNDESEDNA